MAASISPVSAQQTTGRIFVDGPSHDRQVFASNPEGAVQVTDFEGWELIEGVFISPDQDHVAVYHRSNGDSAFKFSLFDLATTELIAEIYPGWRCDDVHWTESHIIYRWATSGGGIRLQYYDYDLGFIREINSFDFYIDRASDIVIALPSPARGLAEL